MLYTIFRLDLVDICEGMRDIAIVCPSILSKSSVENAISLIVMIKYFQGLQRQFTNGLFRFKSDEDLYFFLGKFLCRNLSTPML